MSLKLYFFSLPSLVSVLLFSECKKETMDLQKTAAEIDVKENKVSYLALGDSYTKAECELPTNAYPVILTNRLKENGVIFKSQKTIAQTGWRTDDLKNAINNASLQDTFDMVSLLIGVNNQYQGRSSEEYKIQFLDLLETSIQLAKGRKDKVFVVSIPDYGVTPFGNSNESYISAQIDIFNAINKKITDSMHVRYFDITPISRQAKTDPSLTCSDGLHPSVKMYNQWVDLMFPDILTLIQKP
jgi:lysophospholipase L1-like esterase